MDGGLYFLGIEATIKAGKVHRVTCQELLPIMLCNQVKLFVASVLVAASAVILPAFNVTAVAAPTVNTVLVIKEEKPKPSLPPIFKEIARCESGNELYPNGRQYKEDGTVFMSTTGDYGRYQINQIHLPETRKLGIDITTDEGNTAFALLLYQRNGTRDWYKSRHCWGH